MRTILFCVVALSVSPAWATPITYTITIPGITGSVTTDGASGKYIGQPDITAWNWSGYGRGAHGNTTHGGFLDGSINGSFLATPSSLSIPYLGYPDVQFFQQEMYVGHGYEVAIFDVQPFTPDDNVVPGHWGVSVYVSGLHYIAGTGTQFLMDVSSTPPSGPFVFATSGIVPEPSSGVLGLLGLLLIGLGWFGKGEMEHE